MKKDNRQRVIDAAKKCVEEMRQVKKWVPRDSGNLANHALRYDITETEMKIYIDQEIAPYMPYTNEAWLAEKWNGRKNPNEGWWQRFVAEFARRLAKKLRGKIL